MPLPPLSKTWQFSINQAIASGSTQYQAKMLALKNSFIGFGTLPWTVRGSSDSSTAGMDAVDRWAAAANLVWGTGAHSWIVLRQTGLGSTFEIVIDLNHASQFNATVAFSFTGFSGGSTTARPTAADELVIMSQAAWTYTGGTGSQTILSVMQSTDGKCTRVIEYRANISPMLWVLDAPQFPMDNWTNQFVSIILGGTAAVGTYTNLIFAATGPWKARVGSLLINTHGVVEGVRGQAIGQRLATLDTPFPMSPIGLANHITWPSRQRLGNLFDLWMGNSQTVVDGDTYPNDTSYQFLQAGHLIHPWAGVLPTLA